MRIKTVRFFENDKDCQDLLVKKDGLDVYSNMMVLPALEKMQKWEEVPDLAILTGANGSGKTQLLKYLSGALTDYRSEIFHMGGDFKHPEETTKKHNLPIYENESDRAGKMLESYGNGDSELSLGERTGHLEHLTRMNRLGFGANKSNDGKSDADLKTELKALVNELKAKDPMLFWKTVFNAYHDKHGMCDEAGKITPPWEELNKILRDNKFGYSIDVFSKSFAGKDEFTWGFKKDGVKPITKTPIHFSELSDGEKLIFSTLTWTFDFDLRTGIDRSVKIMILDEPDKHLDPQSCKLFMDLVKNVLVKKFGIQVIMTTHRMDTISLAPEGSIFSIDQDAKKIKPCSKLLAHARLSKNIRDFSNFHVKVLTEGFEDALFYNEVYRLLLALEKDLKGPRFFSRRWQPEFHSVCFEAGNGGGCSIVIPNVMRAAAAYGKMRERPESLFKPKLQKPFGLVDDDYGNTSEMCDKEGVEPGRVLILKRHSLENYTYDPFILSSLLSDDELKENIGNASLRNALIDLKNSKTQPEAQKAVDQYFSDIFKIIESEEKMKELSKNVNAVFNKIEFTSALLDKKDVGKIGGEAKIGLKKSDDFRSKDGKKDLVSDFVRKNYCLYKQDSKNFIEALEIEIQEKLNDFIKDKYSEDDIVVKIDLSKFELTLQSGEKEVAPSDDGNKMSKIPANDIDIYIVGRDYKIKYPRDFLAARGHDIEDTFLVMENAEDAKSFAKYYEFKEGIVNFFHDKIEGVQFPADLLSVYNELSNAIRTQVNKVAKDESYEVKDEKKFTQEKWEYRVKKTKAPSLAV